MNTPHIPNHDIDLLVDVLKNSVGVVIVGGSAMQRGIVCQQIIDRFDHPKKYDASQIGLNDPAAFDDCSPNTDLIVITDCPDDYDYDAYEDLITSGMTIHVDGEPVDIHPCFLFMGGDKPPKRLKKRSVLYYLITVQ